MKIYTFWSADTTYFTKFKSLKKAQEVGKHNMEVYLKCCKEAEAETDQFIPKEVESVTKGWFNHIMKTDSDTLILEDELYDLIK